MAPCTMLPPLLFERPFYRSSVPSRNQETVPPSYYSTLSPATPCHLQPTCRNRVAVPPGAPPKHHRAICHQHAATVSPCYLVRPRVTTMLPCDLMRHRVTTVEPCHLVSHRDTIVPPCHLVHHHDTAVPPCRRAAAVPTRHIGIPPYAHSPCKINHAPDSCQSYLRSF